MVRAVFLDRDGVINKAFVRDGLPFPPQSLADFVILEGVAEACRVLKAAGFLLVVATNQPDVGRGTQSKVAVEQMHEAMCRELPIDRVEVCYDPGGQQTSSCRKPAPGMLLSAASALDIDLGRSYMVGDRWRDIDCGAAAGCTTILIDHRYQEALRQQPHFKVSNLLEAAKIILEK